MAYLWKNAASKIIRLKEYEIDTIRQKYVLNYYYQACILIRRMTPETITHLCADFGCVSRNVQVLFGRYMDKPLLVFQREGEGN